MDHAPRFALHLVVDDVDESITWYQEGLGAEVTRLLRLPDQSILIADLDVHGLPVAIAAPVLGTTLASPAATGTSVGAYRLTVDDADAAVQRALAAGATLHSAVRDAFWGVRTGEVLDPSGHRWGFDQHLREVAVDEIERNLAGLTGGS
ncbi:VOC family protein [Amycolatopsis sp. SID8362]|nr:VOC family protein [Amycolatopsis sp. SID8362]NBH01694.1 VOC family protein [Amycolatopsis sp. SID8362]NED38395.1 VOC family protein [Amycolatopsis sp. SID8362]